MRMWMVNPQMMCRQHLLGEHAELHMFVGCLIKGISLKGYIKGGLVEIHKIKERHEELVWEMGQRGFNHQSPLPPVKLYEAGEINVGKNMTELANRCKKCKKRIQAVLDN